MKRVTAAVLLLALLALLLLGEIKSHPPGAETRRAQPAPTLGLSAADLEAGRLPTAARLRLDEGGRHIYASVIGPLALTEAFVQRGTRAGRAALGRAVAGVLRAGLATEEKPWTWESLPPVGGLLLHATNEHAVIDGYVLRREGVPQLRRGAEKKHITQAVEAYIATGMPRESISPWVVGALADLMRRLDDEPGNPALGTLDGDFARRVFVQDGWLTCIAGAMKTKPRAALMAAVTDSLVLRPELRFVANGRRLVVFGNTWGTQGLLLRTETRVVFVRSPPEPMQAEQHRSALKTCRLLYDLEIDADPLADPTSVARATAAWLVQGDARLAQWSRTTGLRANQEEWRRVFPVPKAESTLVRDGWPPHLPLIGPGGTLHGLALPRGVLEPVQDHSDEEAERFLDDAARLLPDAAHLDLIQQYFLRYAWDSPDLTQPLMLGCEKFHDEIHQTAHQVLDTCSGGICRGDCDDVAEFVQTVLSRQGKLAHVVNLPGHLATIWAERRDKIWRAFVLQSGPSREFHDTELPAALEQAYLALDENAPFDRNNLSTSLRFAGQNTRSPYGLSWRIFMDRAYADAMLEVQADWNRMTLLRAEQKMLRRIEAGDEMSANYGELAALCDWMARPDEALAFDRRALAGRTDPESRLLKNIELIGYLAQTGRQKEAESALAVVLKKDLPALVPDLGLRALVIAHELADLISADAPLLAARTLATLTHWEPKTIGTSLGALLQSKQGPHKWREHEENEALQSFMEDYAWTALSVMRRTAGQSGPDPDGITLKAVLDPWLGHHAFDDADAPEDVSYRWALKARRLALDDPEFLQHLTDAIPPTSAEKLDHAAMARGATEEVVRSWTRASPWFFAYELADLVSNEDKRPDPFVIRRLSALMNDAEEAARRLGLYGPDAQTEQRGARLQVALLLKDEAVLRAVLRESRELNDRYASESVAADLGRTAVHLDLPTWRMAMQCWVEEIDNPVHYFHIAWSAVGVKAKQHALYVAQVAADRYPEDDAIQEEARLMRAHLQ